MAAVLSPVAKQQFLTNAGELAAGYKLYTRNSNSGALQATYINRAGTIPNTNPIILDARGEAIIYLTPGVIYDYELRTDTDALEWTREDIEATAGDANAVIFLQSGSGAVARPVDSRLKDKVSIKDFGAVGDGVTDDSMAIDAAVAYAAAAGTKLEWPAGVYLTSFSITGLHTVRHRGPGQIKRGSDTFYPDPGAGQVNRLYVATTGSNLNDGLSASQPVQTINTALNFLPNYGPALNGDWRVILAAGTYGSCTVPSGLGNRSYIRIWGPTVGHPNTPTAIIDAGGASNGACLVAQEHTRLDVRDIKMQNATGSLSIGLAATMFCDVYCNNVHAENIFTGVQVTQNSRLRMTGGVFTKGANGSIGVAVGVTSSMSIGYQSPGVGNGPRFNNLTQGVKITENTTGHVDYCVFTGCGVDIEISQNCRVNDVSNTHTNWTVAAVRSTLSCYADAGTPAYSNSNPAVPRYINDGTPGYLQFITGTQGETRVANSTTTISHTGTTTKTILATPFTVPAGYLTTMDKKMRVVIYGRFTGSGVLTVGVDFTGNVMGATASSGVTSNTVFRSEFEIWPTGVATQKVSSMLTQDTSIARNDYNARAINMAVAIPVQIVGTLTNAADTLEILAYDVYMMG